MSKELLPDFKAEQRAIKAAKVADAVRDIVAATIHQPGAAFFITVNSCTISPDFKRATAWVTVFPKDKTVAALTYLKRQQTPVQRALHQNLQRKIVPLIQFEIDTTEEDAAHMDSLLANKQ